MTSSLVGSEMCIRDSLSRTHPHLELNPLAPHPPCRTRRRDILRRRSPHPVSYTHLTLPTICSV
eukprot:3710584-Prorocentrum_lima.AAC.1